jgi:hypothetical protein
VNYNSPITNIPAEDYHHRLIQRQTDISMHYQNQKRDCTEEGVRETEKEISTLVHTRKGSIAKEGKGIERLHKNIHYNQSISSMFNQLIQEHPEVEMRNGKTEKSVCKIQ